MKTLTPAYRQPEKTTTPAYRQPEKTTTPAHRQPEKATIPAGRQPEKTTTSSSKHPEKTTTPASRQLDKISFSAIKQLEEVPTPAGKVHEKVTGLRPDKEYFTTLDEELTIAAETPDASKSKFQLISSHLDRYESYEKYILTHLKSDNLDKYSGKLICEDGKSVEIPLTILCLAWPWLYSLVGGMASCCQKSDISVSVPCNFETALCVKEMILSSEVPKFDSCQVVNVLTFFKDTYFEMVTVKVKQPSDETGLREPETVIIEESFSDDEEESFEDMNVFSENVIPRQSTAKICSHVCINDCDKMVKSWSKEKIENVKSLFTAEKLIDRKKMLLSHLSSQGNIGSSTDGYLIFGHHFCLKYLSFLIEISAHVLKSVLEDYWRDVKTYLHGNKGVIKQHSVATIGFIVWFKQFLTLFGQAAPDEEITILSHWLCGKVLYGLYTAEAPKPHVAQTTFYQHMKKHFGANRQDKTLPCVRISAYSSHSVCDICIALNQNQKMCKNEAELNMSTSLRNQHRMDVGMTRKAVESIRQSAMDFSEDNLYIQCDGNYCSFYTVNE